MYWLDDGNCDMLVHSASIMPVSLIRPPEKMASVSSDRGHDSSRLRKTY